MRRLVAFVSLVVFVDTMFYAAITPLLPELSDRFDLSKTAAGVLAAAYPAGTFLGSIPGG
jgi:predicted MFS family arabinose efflux permease